MTNRRELRASGSRLFAQGAGAFVLALLPLAISRASASSCVGSVCTVSVGADSGTSSSGSTGADGTLSYALAYANAQNGAVTINIDKGLAITLSGPLSPIFNSVTINGNGATIDGANTTRIFMVGVDTASQTSAAVVGSIIAQKQSVAINDLTLANGLAQGGNGGASGGGGLGAGGALFVNQSATVTLTGVSFATNAARGGNSGAWTNVGFGGGGGGLGGNGSSGGGGGGMLASSTSVGGAGLFGAASGIGGGGYSGAGGTTGAGSNGKLLIGGLSSGGGAGGAPGGANGGGGGGDNGFFDYIGGGGGFGGGNQGRNFTAGSGGFGGGGGSSLLGGYGGNGGYGGGGGEGGASGAGGFGGGGGEGAEGGFGGGGGGGTIGANGGFGAGGGGGSQGFGIGKGGFGGGDAASVSVFFGPGGGGGAMGGAVFVVKGGSLIINGDGSSAGGTVLGGTSGGAGAGNGAAYGSGFFVEGSALTFGSGNYTISDAIADLNGSAANATTDDGLGGFGGATSLAKVGAGVLTLSGANTYSGPTTVSGGELEVDGSIASNVAVNGGGVLQGVGAVGATMVNAGGALAPGGGAGTKMTITGDLTLLSGSAYLVKIGSAGASSAQVMGTATLGGDVFVEGAASPSRTYVILDAVGGIGGTKFASLSTEGSNFVSTLGYGATDVTLTFGAAQLGGGTLTGNSARVANALDAAYNANGALPTNFGALYSLGGAALSGAISAATGEAATAEARTSFQASDSFLNTMLDPSAGGRFAPGATDGPALSLSLTPSAGLHNWTSWASATGGFSRTAGDLSGTGSHDVSSNAGGLAAGADYRLSRDSVVGFAIGGGAADWSLAQGLGGGRGDFLQTGVYGSTRLGAAYLSGDLAFANWAVTTHRAGPLGDTLGADYMAQNLGARLEGGYRFAAPFGGLTPYAAIEPQWASSPGYRESDASQGGFGLSYAGAEATDTSAELGLRLDSLFALGNARTLSLRGRVAWLHDWSAAPSVGARFEALPSVGFTTIGAAPARDAALLSGGAELSLAKGVSLGGTFDGDLAGRSSVYDGDMVLKANF